VLADMPVLPAGWTAAILAGPLLLSLAVVYGLLRSRDARSPAPDPHLGIKTVYYFAFSLSVLLALTGVTFIVSDAIEESDLFGAPSRPDVDPMFGPVGPRRFGDGMRGSSDWRTAQRLGSALIVAGLAVGLLHAVLILTTTNDLRRPGVRRVFIGYRLAIHGVVNLTAFTMLMMQLFQKEDFSRDVMSPVLAVLLIWGPSWIVHLVLLNFAARGGAEAPRVPSVAFED
jgi:hypothetical protein